MMKAARVAVSASAPFWGGVLMDILGSVSVQASSWPLPGQQIPWLLRHTRATRWTYQLLQKTFRRAHVLHIVGAHQTPHLFLARWVNKPVVLHWIGSDVLQITRDKRFRKELGRKSIVHCADSPSLAAELESLGIQAKVIRLLPRSLLPEAELPWPSQPCVLSYWSHLRRDFYGGKIVDQLADAFPHVQFLVVGSDGKNEPQHANMRYLGLMQNIDEAYAQTTVLLRIPEHDGVSAMVLEALSRGRRVIYSQPFPHTCLARTVADVTDALNRCLLAEGPDREGEQYVRTHFCRAAETMKILELYRAFVPELRV
jgi:hypothetical protein